MPGNPATVTFLKNGDEAGSYIACSPLTENINQKHRNELGEIVCDFYVGCTGADS